MSQMMTDDKAQFLSELTQQYGDVLTKYARRFFGYQPQMLPFAEEAVQETLIKAIHDVDRLRDHPNVIGWLKLSLRNVLLNIRRERHWELEEPQETIRDSSGGYLYTVLDSFEQLDGYPRLSEVTEVAKSILTPEEYETFYDHFLVGLTIAETAEVEQIARSMIHSRIIRIRKKLRNYFKVPFCLLIFFLRR